MIRQIYDSQCGPGCPPLTKAGVQDWRLPLQQPGFDEAVQYTLHHGVPGMTASQLDQLHASSIAKRAMVGADDPQFSIAAATQTADRISAPAPTVVPGGHLTMISAPQQVAAGIRQLAAATGR